MAERRLRKDGSIEEACELLAVAKGFTGEERDKVCKSEEMRKEAVCFFEYP